MRRQSPPREPKNAKEPAIPAAQIHCLQDLSSDKSNKPAFFALVSFPDPL